MSDSPHRYYAHSSNGQGQWHDLADHLRSVAKLAGEFAAKFGAQDYGHLAGLWHDLGKYSDAFQNYLKGSSGAYADAHVETAPGRVNHSTAGAIYAVQKLRNRGKLLAYLIAGHHAGLPDWHGDENAAASLSVRLTHSEHLGCLPTKDVPLDITEPKIELAPQAVGAREGLHLWLRILFSCLVDADSLDTEHFTEPEKSAQRSNFPSISALLDAFDHYMKKFELSEKTPVNLIRAQVLGLCRTRAADAPGVYSLTVPTGGGKTLSGLAFALNHAVNHGMSRVIYAIPYTSIVEQTAQVFREVFGGSLVEHHSNLDPEKESAQSLLASENWDAPLIVTTNVQFFESLFEARRSRCRKLHNIVNSVVVLDETQLLPPEFLQPILGVMNLLVKHYRVTFLLSTATQPALGSFQTFERNDPGLEGVREVVPDPQSLHLGLKRVEVTLPDDFHVRGTWEKIAAEVSDHERVLAIVNTRADCRELHRRLPDGTIHLSAAMCGEHRARVIAAIKDRLRVGAIVRVVSTQLVEAGVDLDFPVVFRALSGLDSIAQAAGRCNREGRLQSGRVVVFLPPKPSPLGTLRRAEETAVSILSGGTVDPLGPCLSRLYFQYFYSRAASLDRAGILELLTADAGEINIQFRTAAQKFRLIDDAESRPVIVWYGEGQSLARLLEKKGPERWLLRKLQRYTVNIPKPTVDRLVAGREVAEVHGMYVQSVDTLYDDKVGFVSNAVLSSEQLVI